MTLTDPREALADKSDFIAYLVGLAAVADMVRALAADGGSRARSARECDDFIYALLGLASTGAAVERMSNCVTALQNPTVEVAPATRFLR